MKPVETGSCWEKGWDGHAAAQLRRLARLSLIEKLEWLEEAHRVVLQLQAEQGGHHTLRAQIATRNRALAAFNRWEASHHGSPQPPEQVIAALGTLYDLLPAASRRRVEDPQRNGVRSMHQALRHLHQRQ